jgi:hypothetical protein
MTGRRITAENYAFIAVGLQRGDFNLKTAIASGHLSQGLWQACPHPDKKKRKRA